MRGRKRECEVEGTASAKVLRWELTKAKTGLWELGKMFLDEVSQRGGRSSEFLFNDIETSSSANSLRTDIHTYVAQNSAGKINK